MDRRELLALIGAGVSTSLLAPLSASERFDAGRAIHDGLETHLPALSAAEMAQVTRIADLVVPATDTPGALDVQVPAFIDRMMATWYSAPERTDFTTGLAALDRRAGSGGFVAQSEAAQVALLKTLDGKPGPKGSAEAAFTTLKGLTIYGYFTSERVQKEVLKTVIIPGRFDGCIPFPRQ